MDNPEPGRLQNAINYYVTINLLHQSNGRKSNSDTYEGFRLITDLLVPVIDFLKK